MRNLVIGMGEIGTSIYKVLNEKYEVEGIGRKDTAEGVFDVLHVCFPYGRDFNEQVRQYAREYLKAEGGLVVVHSTTPLGTCDDLGVVHSPVRGVHPNLVSGIKTFTKYFGGIGAEEAAELFERLGIATEVRGSAKETEAGKMWSTTAYGWLIMLEKEIHAYCEEHGLDFDFVYGHFTETYNIGYNKLDMAHVQRPVLKHMPGPIGGHCVIPNSHLLGGDIADFILNKQEELCSSAIQPTTQD